jgi:6,7-dimethyl-8-ribityllumazine synthase
MPVVENTWVYNRGQLNTTSLLQGHQSLPHERSVTGCGTILCDWIVGAQDVRGVDRPGLSIGFMNDHIALISTNLPFSAETANASFCVSLDRLGVRSDRIDRFFVDRPLELPLQARAAASTLFYSAIVVSALVRETRGYTENVITQTLRDGLERAQAQTSVSMFCMVLARGAYVEESHMDQALRFSGTRVAAECARLLGLLTSIDSHPVRHSHATRIDRVRSQK